MATETKSIEAFIEALYVASLVEGKSLEEIVKIANANGYAFSSDEAAVAFKQTNSTSGHLPKWLKRKVEEADGSAYYKD